MKLKSQSDNHNNILEEFDEQFTYEKEYGIKGSDGETRHLNDIRSFLLQKLQEERERVIDECIYTIRFDEDISEAIDARMPVIGACIKALNKLKAEEEHGK